MIPPTFKFKIELQHHDIHLISRLSFVSTTHLSYTSRFSVLSTGRGGVWGGGGELCLFLPHVRESKTVLDSGFQYMSVERGF